MPSSNGSSSLLSLVEMPGKFHPARIVRAKSNPTTQITTGDGDWAMASQPQATPDEQMSVKASGSKVTHDEPDPSAHNGTSMRMHGLLTPHASMSQNLVERDFSSDRNSLPLIPSVRNDSQVSETEFTTPKISPIIGEASDMSLTQRVEVSESGLNNSSIGHASYVSVGVQTSLSYSSSSCVCSALSSFETPRSSDYVTPKASPKRKQRATPEYIREGERLARELEEDLIYVAKEKRRLKRSLIRIERKERELQSLLIPSPPLTGEVEKSGTEDEPTDTEADSALCPRCAPLTSANSDYGKTIKPVAASKTDRSLECSSSTDTSYVSAASQPSNASTIRESKNGTASTDTAFRVPGYTFAEGSSTASSVLSPKNGQPGPWGEALDLAPNPICDPSTYLIWFDLETTDAVRPAANIRILEIAVLITDKNYQYLDKGKSFIVHWPLSAEEIANEMSERVREMHEKSGLLKAYAATPPKERLTLAQVERRLCKYLDRHGIEPNGRAIMAGAGVAFDRGMVRQHMEKLNVYFSHQVFDTTTLWHAIRRKYGRTKRFSVTCVHRALDDIVESSREAKLYSELVLRPSGEVHWPTQSSQGI